LETFLQQVAFYIAKQNNDYNKDLKIVFPNRRSIVFFTEAFRNNAKNTMWMPELVTISDFVSSYSNLVSASDISLLFELYNTYIKHSNSKESFDQFFNWGEILLKDFDDIDKYLVNPNAVFTNVKDLKELDSTHSFLTDEQIEVLKRFFKNFTESETTVLKKSFMEVWQVMLPVYLSYNEILKSRNLAYEGAIFRQASENVIKTNTNDLPNVAFVGFNAITKCEEVIFEHFSKHNKAIFFWDYDLFYINDKYQEAGLFLRKYLQKFPLPTDFILKSKLVSNEKAIQIISSSTDHGQISVASQILSDSSIDISQTALVLANEELLFPVINSLPANVTSINPTMGYSVMKSNAGSFCSLFFKLHQNKRMSANGVCSYYYIYVLRLLKHPFFVTLSNKTANELINKITENNIFYVNEELLCTIPLLSVMLKKSTTTSELQNVFEKTLSMVIDEYIQLAENNNTIELDLEMLYETRKIHRQLVSELSHKKLEPEQATYIKIFTKQLHSLRIPFEGEMTGGLQLMGFLETRNLDFANIIILSVNEGQLPLNQVRTSFIPYSLRKGFGLPDAEMHGAMYAYYFFRLLQRATNVTLVYNNGESGLDTGERSRFIPQLIFNNNFNTIEKSVQQSISSSVKTDNIIYKNESIQKSLNEFLSGDNKRILSPSSIVRYLTCPLKFCYYSLLRLYEHDEVEENVDARIFGNIFHKAAEDIYKPYTDNGKLLTEPEFQKLDATDNIQKIVAEAFNDSFNKNGLANFQIVGKNILVESVVESYLRKMLEIDKQYAPLNILETEGVHYSNINFSLSGIELSVKVGGTIDRIDSSANGVRIIDYKTGSDELVFDELNDVFNPLKISKNKAILQTFIYSLVYYRQTKSAVIRPSIMQVRKLFIPNLKVNIESKKEIGYASGNFVDIAEEFNIKLQHLLSEIFNPDIPFTETVDKKNCTYCAYKLLCGKG